MNQFVKFISQFISLPNKDTITLESVLSNKTFKAGDRILQEGSICNSILFMVSGKARSYFVNHEGQEFTWNFYFNDINSKFENYFLVDYNSFLGQTPTYLSFEALEDIQVIALSYTNIQKIVSDSIFLEKVASIMSANAYQSVHKRAFTLLTSNAKERYLQLLKDEPYLLNKFQHYLISSYLGVAPQSLSRLRKEIIKL
jgi:CRP-like cAMP-binding protein